MSWFAQRLQWESDILEFRATDLVDQVAQVLPAIRQNVDPLDPLNNDAIQLQRDANTETTILLSQVNQFEDLLFHAVELTIQSVPTPGAQNGEKYDLRVGNEYAHEAAAAACHIKWIFIKYFCTPDDQFRFPQEREDVHDEFEKEVTDMVVELCKLGFRIHTTTAETLLHVECGEELLGLVQGPVLVDTLRPGFDEWSRQWKKIKQQAVDLASEFRAKWKDICSQIKLRPVLPLERVDYLEAAIEAGRRCEADQCAVLGIIPVDQPKPVDARNRRNSRPPPNIDPLEAWRILRRKPPRRDPQTVQRAERFRTTRGVLPTDPKAQKTRAARPDGEIWASNTIDPTKGKRSLFLGFIPTGQTATPSPKGIRRPRESQSDRANASKGKVGSTKKIHSPTIEHSKVASTTSSASFDLAETLSLFLEKATGTSISWNDEDGKVTFTVEFAGADGNRSDPARKCDLSRRRVRRTKRRRRPLTSIARRRRKVEKRGSPSTIPTLSLSSTSSDGSSMPIPKTGPPSDSVTSNGSARYEAADDAVSVSSSTESGYGAADEPEVTSADEITEKAEPTLPETSQAVIDRALEQVRQGKPVLDQKAPQALQRATQGEPSGPNNADLRMLDKFRKRLQQNRHQVAAMRRRSGAALDALNALEAKRSGHVYEPTGYGGPALHGVSGEEEAREPAEPTEDEDDEATDDDDVTVVSEDSDGSADESAELDAGPDAESDGASIVSDTGSKND